MKIFYDVNLRPECYSDAVVMKSLAHTDFLKLNLEEWRQLESMLGLRKDDAAFARDLMESHAVEVVLLTQGAKGSQWFSRHGRYHQQPREPENAVDTVGAGDAFAAVAAVGYMKHWAPEKTLSLAQQLAERICAVRGALPESDAVYTPLRKELHG
jgi:fructokinase